MTAQSAIESFLSSASPDVTRLLIAWGQGDVAALDGRSDLFDLGSTDVVSVDTRAGSLASKGVSHASQLVAASGDLHPAAGDDGWAQGLSWALIGSVKDEQGGALQGALVHVTSPALIGGMLTATTNEKGQLRFPVLAPGTYALTVELPPKFAPYREENITIGAGATLERTVVLALAGVAETVVVEGTSRIEARSSGFETRFGQDYLKTIPTRRFSMFDMIRAAPGVSPTSPSSGTVNTVSAFGSGVNENAS